MSSPRTFRCDAYVDRPYERVRVIILHEHALATFLPPRLLRRARARLRRPFGVGSGVSCRSAMKERTLCALLHGLHGLRLTPWVRKGSRMIP
jgi:hypothetical protein